MQPLLMVSTFTRSVCLSLSHLVLFVRDLLFSQVTGKENTEDTYDVNLTNVKQRERRKETSITEGTISEDLAERRH